jgi:hypothetical protein
MYVRWNSDWSCDSLTKVFESVEVLLEWCALDPVDTWEMGRNEVVGAIQGNRNVFIDYPEYAWLVFGCEVPENMTTPSGMAMLKEETTLEETTSSVTEVETSTETLQVSQTTEAKHDPLIDDIVIPNPEEDNGCGGFSEYTVLMLIPVLFAALKKKKK